MTKEELQNHPNRQNLEMFYKIMHTQLELINATRELVQIVSSVATADETILICRTLKGNLDAHEIIIKQRFDDVIQEART